MAFVKDCANIIPQYGPIKYPEEDTGHNGYIRTFEDRKAVPSTSFLFLVTQLIELRNSQHSLQTRITSRPVGCPWQKRWRSAHPFHRPIPTHLHRPIWNEEITDGGEQQNEILQASY